MDYFLPKSIGTYYCQKWTLKTLAAETAYCKNDG